LERLISLDNYHTVFTTKLCQSVALPGDKKNTRKTMSDSADRPSVGEFYKGKNIFVTGATGFLGTVLIEALLSVSPDIGRIYVLIRGKNGKSAMERIKRMLGKQVSWNG
jgi:FlaA1/EpsC-like NDP-sugar epimerase